MNNIKKILCIFTACLALSGCKITNSDTIEQYTDDVQSDDASQEEEDNVVFEGLGNISDTNVYGNLTINSKDSDYRSYFCVDEEGALYYTNLLDKSCLYSFDGSVTEKLTDIKAVYMNIIGDYIYFISPLGSVGEYTSRGAIYRYSRTSGEYEIFIDENANALYATGDGLYYQINETITDGDTTTVKPTLYYRPFDSDESEKCDYLYSFLRYGDYQLTWRPDSGDFALTDGTNEIALCSDTETMAIIPCSCVYNGKLYSSWSDTLNIFNLLTGEKTVYDIGALTYRSDGVEISGYTVIDNYIYVALGSSNIYRIDESGEVMDFHSDDGGYTNTIMDLYTDGTELYALMRSKIVKITPYIDEYGLGRFTAQEIGE